MFDTIAKTPSYQTILKSDHIQLDIKRLDLVHPQISGNKFYKLQYNLEYAKKNGLDPLITFGGAYSNHIAATAYAAHYFNFKSVGIIRGEELANKALNQTLQTASNLGMQLKFITRQNYRRKNETNFLDQLYHDYPNAYILPEGGTNHLAIQGCKEILTPFDLENYDVICCAVGTGGTLTGLIESSHSEQLIIGFSALKGEFLIDNIRHFTKKKNWMVLDNYCFGGYAKNTDKLRNFLVFFEENYSIPIEPIYTGKMLFGVFDLIKTHFFSSGTKILAIHSGGLQGKI